MGALEIDIDATGRAARTWVAWGDAILRAQLTLADELASLGLPSADARGHLGATSAELWANAVFVELVADRARRGDRLDAGALAELRAMAGDRVVTAAGFVRPPAPSGGDHGGTFGAEARSPWLLDGATAVAFGRALVLRALSDTADPVQIRRDELEIVRLGDGRVLVVLPGVTDLAPPQLGLDPATRTVRDVDRAAFGSAGSTSVADNPYARMVVEAIRHASVRPGSELVLVGHSFGADTALDLAADAAFNGPHGYRVSHVVAAAYHSVPQLAAVPARTEVLVVQNRTDLVVAAERAAAPVREAVESRRDLAASLLRGDLPGAIGHGARALAVDVGIVLSAARTTATRADDAVRLAGAAAGGDARRVDDRVLDVLAPEPGVRRVDGHLVVVFEGGAGGAGHTQSHYTEHLAATDDPDVLRFFASLGGSASTVGASEAVDVSVP